MRRVRMDIAPKGYINQFECPAPDCSEILKIPLLAELDDFYLDMECNVCKEKFVLRLGGLQIRKQVMGKKRKK